MPAAPLSTAPRRRVEGLRLMGLGLGLITLMAALLLPFYQNQNGPGSFTLFQTLTAIGQNSGTYGAMGVQYSAPMAVVFAAAGLVVFSGLIGFFPLGSAIFGTSGMLIMTILPYLAESGFNPALFASGVGFWVIWVTSLSSFVPAARLGKRGERVVVRERQLLVVQPIILPRAADLSAPVVPGLADSPKLADVLTTCPSCGARNLKTAEKCMECGGGLRKDTIPPEPAS